ncbi:MAG TPA: tetratricopeptide repeat protein, partial [Bryobacterales bacterium]|nr:tetratricopeptide repeat protein [Bryobacterales bacterium]
AEQLLPASAAPPFHLAQLYVETGRLDEARSFYRKALAIDPSYRTPYNGFGLWRIWDRRFREAKQELRRTLELDPDDPYAHYGLGRIAAAKKRWGEAEGCFREALRANANCIDALRWLARALEEQGRGEEAIEAYVCSLRLVLAGHKPLGAPIVTLAGRTHLSDQAHWDVHGRLARLYDRKGLDKEAINGYRMAMAGGCDSLALRARLARLYLKRKEWGKGSKQMWEAGKQAPRALWTAARRAHYRAKRAIEERIRSFAERRKA